MYRRAIRVWGLSNTLDSQASLEVIRQVIRTKGKPEILNCDQGSHFTCLAYMEEEGIKISMDGKERSLGQHLYRAILENDKVSTYLFELPKMA